MRMVDVADSALAQPQFQAFDQLKVSSEQTQTHVLISSVICGHYAGKRKLSLPAYCLNLQSNHQPSQKNNHEVSG